MNRNPQDKPDKPPTFLGSLWRMYTIPVLGIGRILWKLGQFGSISTAVFLIVGWCNLLYLPALARSHGSDPLFLSLRCRDFETSRPVWPLRLLVNEKQFASLVTDIRWDHRRKDLGGKATKGGKESVKDRTDVLTPKLYLASQQLNSTLWNLDDPVERAHVLAWGDGLMRVGTVEASPLFSPPDVTPPEAYALTAVVLRGIQPNAEQDLGRLKPMAEAAFPNPSDYQAALAWAGTLYDRLVRLERDYHAHYKYRQPLAGSRTENDEAVTTTMPPRTEATLWWLVYQFVGLDVDSRRTAATHWASLFPEGRRDRIRAIGERLERDRRLADEPLPPTSEAVAWVCLIERYQGLDAQGQRDQDLLRDRCSHFARNWLSLGLLFANPSDDLVYIAASGDPLNLVLKADVTLGLICAMILVGTYGMRLLLFPVLAEFLLRLHHNSRYRTYRDGRGHGTIWVRLIGYLGIPVVAWLIALLYLPDDLVPVAGSPGSMLLASFLAVGLGGMMVAFTTRVTAFLMLCGKIDINRVWYDEFLGLTLGLGLLWYFGNDWINLMVFAAAELVPMLLQPRPKPENEPREAAPARNPVVVKVSEPHRRASAGWLGTLLAVLLLAVVGALLVYTFVRPLLVPR